MMKLRYLLKSDILKYSSKFWNVNLCDVKPHRLTESLPYPEREEGMEYTKSEHS